MGEKETKVIVLLLFVSYLWMFFILKNNGTIKKTPNSLLLGVSMLRKQGVGALV